MNQTVRGLREVARRVKAAGHPIEFYSRWETWGHGVLIPRAAVNHHTASSRRSGPAGALGLVIKGRVDLPGPLCNTYSTRHWPGSKITFHVISARLAYHAGPGGWRGISGNSRVLGHEAENNGVGERWADEHLDLIEVKDAAQCDVFGFAPTMVPEHKEWTPRKIDRHGVNGHRHRQRVAVLLQPPPPPPPPVEEDEMNVLKQGGNYGNTTRLLKRCLNQEAEANGRSDVDRLAPASDTWGPKMTARIKQAQAGWGLEPTGDVDGVTLAMLLRFEP